LNVRPLLPLAIVVGLFAASGASCPAFLDRYASPGPRVLPPTPILSQVLDAVNVNTAKVQSFRTSRATLSGPGFPSLHADLAFEAPRRFRLRADTALTGAEADLGSNDELFWFWVRRTPPGQPPAIYFCRHDQFAQSAAGRSMPMDPSWLIESLGLVRFDPGEQHSGPVPRGRGRLAVSTVQNRPGGCMTRIVVVDDVRGWVLEQYLYDQQRQLVASAVASRHRRDPVSGATMPQHVDIQWMGNAFRIDLADLAINQPMGNPLELWTKPEYAGYPNLDLCSPQASPLVGVPPGR
jgi:hypothetical protein